jgi:hypothetical protein
MADIKATDLEVGTTYRFEYRDHTHYPKGAWYEARYEGIRGAHPRYIWVTITEEGNAGRGFGKVCADLTQYKSITPVPSDKNDAIRSTLIDHLGLNTTTLSTERLLGMALRNSDALERLAERQNETMSRLGAELSDLKSKEKNQAMSVAEDPNPLVDGWTLRSGLDSGYAKFEFRIRDEKGFERITTGTVRADEADYTIGFDGPFRDITINLRHIRDSKLFERRPNRDQS